MIPCSNILNGCLAKANFWLNLLCVSWVAVEYSAASGVHSLNDQMVQNHLLLCSLDDILLDRSLGDQPINIHLREQIHIRLRWNHLNRPCGRWSRRLWLTCFFWPILWALAWACRSFWGFQSESKMTTVSAEAKLMPKPPALVDRRKQKSCKTVTKLVTQMPLTTLWNILRYGIISAILQLNITFTLHYWVKIRSDQIIFLVHTPLSLQHWSGPGLAFGFLPLWNRPAAETANRAC